MLVALPPNQKGYRIGLFFFRSIFDAETPTAVSLDTAALFILPQESGNSNTPKRTTMTRTTAIGSRILGEMSKVSSDKRWTD
jgi:hypothetical protein